MTKFASLVIASMLAATPVLAQTTAPTAQATPSAPAAAPQGATKTAPAPAKQAVVVKHHEHRALRLRHVRAECRAEARAEGLHGRLARHAVAKCERAKFAFKSHKRAAHIVRKAVTKTVTTLKG